MDRREVEKQLEIRGPESSRFGMGSEFLFFFFLSYLALNCK